MVSLFGFELRRKSKASPLTGKELTDEDREAAVQVRLVNAEKRRLQKEAERMRAEMELEKQKFELERLRAELNDMRGDDDEEDDEDSGLDSQLTGMLMSAFLRGQTPAPQQENVIPVAEIQKVNYTDEEISTIIDGLPRHIRKLGSKLDDVTLRKFITSQQPNVNDDSIQRAIRIFRQK